MSKLLARMLNYRPALLGESESHQRRFYLATRHVIGWFLIQILIAMAIMLPFNETANAGTSTQIDRSVNAPIGGTSNDPSASAWHNWSANPSNWITQPAVGLLASPVAVPRDNFHLMGTATFTPGATGGAGVSTQMLSGDKWITMNQAAAGTLGISSQDITSKMRAFPSNSAYVFAQYSPENATGRISIQKVEKMPDGTINVYQADFTPWSGELWKAQGEYRDATEVSFGNPGYNPFENFKGATTDPVFHNISWLAMKVAIGHAMRRYGAVVSYTAVSQSRVTQHSSTKSSFFKKKVTTTISGYSKPIWYVGTPMEATPSGETGQICVTGGAGATTSACDDPAHVAIAGVMFSVWKGGNMPANEDLMYQQVTTQSSWNILFFAVILAIVTFGVGLVLLPTFAIAAYIAAGVAAAYAIGSTVFAGGGSVTQAQAGFFGSTGNGWMQAQSVTGAQAGLNNAINATLVTPEIGHGGLTGADRLYSGNCPMGYSVAQCNQGGQDPGTSWRPDSYAEYNGVKALRQRFAFCTAPITSGGLALTGAAAEKCAAPAAMVIP